MNQHTTDPVVSPIEVITFVGILTILTLITFDVDVPRPVRFALVAAFIAARVTVHVFGVARRRVAATAHSDQTSRLV